MLSSFVALSALLAAAPTWAKAPKTKSQTSSKSKSQPSAQPDSSAAAPAAPAAQATPAGKCKEPIKSTCAPANVALGPPQLSPVMSGGDIPGMAAADFNGDGKTDIIISHTSGFLEVLLSKGDGTFEAGKRIEQHYGGNELLALDFDGDCIPDVVAPSFGKSSVPAYVDFLAGKSTGAFKLPVTSSIPGDNIVTLLSADFNRDKRPDLLLDTNGMGSSAPSMLLNTGKGAFASGVTVPAQGVVAAGDLTGDGAAEIAYAADSSKLCVLKNNGNAQMSEPQCYETGGSKNRVLQLEIADLNGDNKKDVVLLTDENDVMINVFLNKGDGTLDDPERFTGHVSQAFRIADADNDGKNDLIIYHGSTGYGGLFVFKNKGNGQFNQKPEHYSIGNDDSRAHALMVAGDWLGNGLTGFATLDWSKDSVSVVSAECRP